MRKIVVYFLALHFASGGQFGKELLYLPNMLAHYQEHNNHASRVSFVAFLRLHYFDRNHNDTDEKHHSLPFRTHFKALVDKALVQELPLIGGNSFCYQPDRMAPHQLGSHCTLAGHALDLLKPPI